ncbi:hypothetical protein Btru_048436 [Bulinus truncatus]|nr:hypothetical protein Btru_048436 [Bulinus truncatus]
MEFLKGLEKAEQRGISRETFLRIWETESSTKQLEIEQRLLEIRTQRDMAEMMSKQPISKETQEHQQISLELCQVKDEMKCLKDNLQNMLKILKIKIKRYHCETRTKEMEIQSIVQYLVNQNKQISDDVVNLRNHFIEQKQYLIQTSDFLQPYIKESRLVQEDTASRDTKERLRAAENRGDQTQPGSFGLVPMIGLSPDITADDESSSDTRHKDFQESQTLPKCVCLEDSSKRKDDWNETMSDNVSANKINTLNPSNDSDIRRPAIGELYLKTDTSFQDTDQQYTIISPTSPNNVVDTVEDTPEQSSLETETIVEENIAVQYKDNKELSPVKETKIKDKFVVKDHRMTLGATQIEDKFVVKDHRMTLGAIKMNNQPFLYDGYEYVTGQIHDRSKKEKKRSEICDDFEIFKIPFPNVLVVTRYFTTKPVQRRVRYNFVFNPNNELVVSLLVASDQRQGIRPIHFIGEGKIRHPESKKFSHLWTFDCKCPEESEPGREVEIIADVCLETACRTCHSVTLKKLAELQFVRDNYLELKVRLNAYWIDL